MADELSLSVRLAFDIALWRLQEQLERSRSLDSRLGNAFGLSAAMIAILGSAVLFADETRTAEIEIAVTAAAGLFVANIVIATVALLIGRMAVAPNLAELLENIESGDYEEVTRWAAEALVHATEGNALQLQLKGWLVSAAVATTAATAVAVASSAILAVQ